MRPAPGALAPLEVAVGCRGAALSAPQHIGVHAEAERTTGVAPLEPRFLEDPIEALALALRLDPLRPGDDHRPHAVGAAPPPPDLRDLPEILDPPVRARAHKHALDR